MISPYFKGNAQFIFLCNPQKSLVNISFMKILKSTVTEKVIVCFYNLGEENFLKVAAFVIFPTSIMVLFEIHQRFKGHFFNELRVSLNETKKNKLFYLHCSSETLWSNHLREFKSDQSLPDKSGNPESLKK